MTTTTITLSRSFEIELEDNTTINVNVSLEAATGYTDDAEEFQANQRIRSFTYDNVLEPLQEALTELFTAEDMADSIGTDGGAVGEDSEQEIIDFYKQGGHKQEVGDLLTADDYPESAE